MKKNNAIIFITLLLIVVGIACGFLFKSYVISVGLIMPAVLIFFAFNDRNNNNKED